MSDTRCVLRLKALCVRAVCAHFTLLDVSAVVELPTSLINDLLPHLNVRFLDELQPALNVRGISTYRGWLSVLRSIGASHRLFLIRTEAEAKQQVMEMLFPSVFYHSKNELITRHISNIDTKSLLLVMAKNLRHFSIRPTSQCLQGLTAEQWPLLAMLESSVRSVGVVHRLDLSAHQSRCALYVLHRLLDHGHTTKVVICEQALPMLAWVLQDRDSCFVSPSASMAPGPETKTFDVHDVDHVPPRKRQLLDSAPVMKDSNISTYPLSPKDLCQTFSRCAGPSLPDCPRGQIQSLQINQCGPATLSILIRRLPSWFSLQSLSLHSRWTFCDSDVLSLARPLKQLSESLSSSLTELSISVLPSADLVDTLLDACTNLTSLSVEIQLMAEGLHHPRSAELATISELPLEKLSVKAAQMQMDMVWLTSLLRRCPGLSWLQVCGIRLPQGSSHHRLLCTLSASNQSLRRLQLEDINLSGCLCDIIKLLSACALEELCLRDCRLVEKCSDKDEYVCQLVSALNKIPSLHSLSLAQNRLGSSVCVLVDLFSGPSQSSVRHLDLSSNFVQPADLLEFGHRLKAQRLCHRLTLDLRENPGDRDPETWNAALGALRPLCELVIEGWNSTNMMADHISNM
ncbi:leucine-rich repeat-containing protein 41 [Thalassophryne amazonica]|uniref:leucine-rich repeat-containing protein 41 n=1 Tax=Thalassophryne amazonica TaxID=390379 RepID=UPI00147257F9|nr:leucine-rich repeat-containing protein 41 [Thalassophryne amazonica]